ncbi:MAG: hypothetical protein HQL21_01295 [Candidatus Omnitrophica bacterium]|nr:hypothetical protein [Candidatus Omnitrophota bacterium]
MKPIQFKGGKKAKPGSDSGEDVSLLKWLRKFDIGFFRYLLHERQFEAGAVMVAVVFIFLASGIVITRLNKVADLDRQIIDLTAKKLPVEVKRKVLQEKKDFLTKAAPGLPEKKFISFLTGLAEKRGIIISEFEPVTVQNKDFYSTTNISFSCSVSSFSKALLFLKDLETSPYSLKIRFLRLWGRGSMDLGPGNIPVQQETPVQINVKLSSLILLVK